MLSSEKLQAQFTPRAFIYKAVLRNLQTSTSYFVDQLYSLID